MCLAKDYGVRACGLMGKATSALSSIRKSMYPDEEDAPKTFSQLVEAFSMKDDPLGGTTTALTALSLAATYNSMGSLSVGAASTGAVDKVFFNSSKARSGRISMPCDPGT